VEQETLLKAKRSAGRAGGSASSKREAPEEAKPDSASSRPEATEEAKRESAVTDQTRPDQRREDKIKADQTRGGGAEAPRPAGCKNAGLRWEEVGWFLDQQNGRVPDRHRAESLAREFFEEMEAAEPPWTIPAKMGEGRRKVANPMGLLVTRLKADGALTEESA